MDVRTTAIAGVGLGLVVLLWQIASVGAGLISVFVPVAVVAQLVVVIGLLARTRTRHSWAQQLAAGTAASAIACVFIGAGSLLTTVVLFPDALATMRAETELALAAAGKSPDEIAAAVAMIAPVPQAVSGVVGTLVTGAVIAALAGIGLRQKG